MNLACDRGPLRQAQGRLSTRGPKPGSQPGCFACWGGKRPLAPSNVRWKRRPSGRRNGTRRPRALAPGLKAPSQRLGSPGQSPAANAHFTTRLLSSTARPPAFSCAMRRIVALSLACRHRAGERDGVLRNPDVDGARSRERCPACGPRERLAASIRTWIGSSDVHLGLEEPAAGPTADARPGSRTGAGFGSGRDSAGTGTRADAYVVGSGSSARQRSHFTRQLCAFVFPPVLVLRVWTWPFLTRHAVLH